MKLEFTVFSTKKELTAGAGFGLFLGFCALLIIGGLLVQSILGDQNDFTHLAWSSEGSWDSIIYVFGDAIGRTLAGSLVIGFILWHLRNHSSQVNCSVLGIVKSNPYLCAAMFILGLAMNLSVYLLLRPIFATESRQISEITVGINDINEWMRYLYIFELIIMAPVVEELLFRCVLYRSFINSFGKVLSAIGTTVLFALVHFDVFLTGHFVDVFYLFLISSTLLLVRELSGSILPSIFAHAGANTAIIFPLWIFS